MTVPGPWITPPPATSVGPEFATFSGGRPRVISAGSFGASFTDLCDTTSSFLSNFALPGNAFGATADSDGNYAVAQQSYYGDIDQISPFDFQWYEPPTVLPVGAYAFEFEDGLWDGAWPAQLGLVTSWHVTFGFTDVTSDVTPNDETVLVQVIPPADVVSREWAGESLLWIPGPDLVGSGSVVMSAGASSVSVTVPLSVSDVAPNPDVPSRLALYVNAALDRQRTHTAPAAGTGREVLAGFGTSTFTWQPPRYRFLFNRLPRLRQWPRDDALGGQPRQNKSQTSTQASARQGWTNTYR